MSRRKTDNLGALAAGRRVVVSAGTLDGPFLAALAKVQISLREENSPSTWGPGVSPDGENVSDNSGLSVDTARQNKTRSGNNA